MHEAVRRVSDQDLARLGRLLKARRDVDRVAGHETLVEPGLAGDDLPGVDADPRRECHADGAQEVVVQARQRDAHLRSRADRTERVVLVDLRDTEDGHHGVADVLLDDAAVKLDNARHLVEVPEHQVAHGLRVERLRERRRVGDVAEQDRDSLSELVLGRTDRLQGSSAGSAEAGAALGLGAARRARCGDARHGRVRCHRSYGRPGQVLAIVVTCRASLQAACRSA